jgi:hypothetical protein
MIQPALNFDKSTPEYADDPVGWAVAMLEKNGQVYRAFRRLCDERLAANPAARIGSKQVIEVLRWFTNERMAGQHAKINNNVAPLFTRLYLIERPQHKDAFSTRRSVWDSLSAAEEERLLLAFEKVRA